MKILMMTSPEPIRNNTGFYFGEKRFPLGIGYLISSLQLAGHDVSFIDQYLKRDFTFNPNDYDYIGVSANTPCWQGALDLLEYIKKHKSPDSSFKVMVGGPHTTIHLNDIPDWVDYIVQGEADLSILSVVDGSHPARIINSERIKDLDSLPMPAYSIFDNMPYVTTVPWFPGKVFNMNTSRGCPYSCKFCSVKKIWGREYHAMSAARVFNDIEYLKTTYAIKGVYFREDNFTIQNSRIYELCDRLKDQDILWACESRVDTLPENMLISMYKAGCRAIYIGFESGSQHILDLLGKDTTVEEGLNVGLICKKIGIKVAASFIIEHPEETHEDTELTEKFIREVEPANVWKNKYREGG